MKIMSYKKLIVLSRISVAVVTLALVMHVDADTVNGVSGLNFVNINGSNVDDGATGKGGVTYNYQIGREEITIDQFQASGVGDSDADFWLAVGGDAPATEVSWHEAARFANYLTSGSATAGAYGIDLSGNVTGVNRASAISTYGTVYVLPTENEWYKAAYYNVGAGQYFSYANGSETAPLIGLGGANYEDVSTWAVGTGLVEQNGTYDMMGNVYEWTQDDATVAGEKVTRGGRYNSTFAGIKSLTSDRDEMATTTYKGIGFRVAVIPEPGTISLMSLSTLGLFITRRVRRRRLGKSIMPLRRTQAIDVFGERAEEAEEVVLDQDSYATEVVFAGIKNVTLWVRESFQSTDQKFWNYMVESHERKVERRVAFRASVKINALNCLDGLLAKIMK